MNYHILTNNDNTMSSSHRLKRRTPVFAMPNHTFPVAIGRPSPVRHWKAILSAPLEGHSQCVIKRANALTYNQPLALRRLRQIRYSIVFFYNIHDSIVH